MRQRSKQVVDDIRQWVDQQLSGLDVGERLPPVRELMRQFGTAQRTVEYALKPYIDSGVITARRGAGLMVSDRAAADESEPWQGDLVVLYRVSQSRLARSLISEMESRLKRRGLSVFVFGYSNEAQALDVLRKLGRFKACLLQIHFETLPIAFLASLQQQLGAIIVDGISVTGIDVTSVGTNWREALSMAFRKLRTAGHSEIAFMTSSHEARQIAMARREFDMLTQTVPHPELCPCIEVDALPGSYTTQQMIDGLRAHQNKDGSLPFSALIVWGVVEGFTLERALLALNQSIGDGLAVVLLGSVDFAGEHMERFDTVGNRNEDKLNLHEQLAVEHCQDPQGVALQAHYLPIASVEFGSVSRKEA